MPGVWATENVSKKAQTILYIETTGLDCNNRYTIIRIFTTNVTIWNKMKTQKHTMNVAISVNLLQWMKNT